MHADRIGAIIGRFGWRPDLDQQLQTILPPLREKMKSSLSPSGAY